MDKVISKIFAIVFAIIACSICYRVFIYKAPVEEKITINEEFTITTGETYAVKGFPESSFKITKIGASLTGYILDYEFKINGNIYNNLNISNSEFELEVISSNYKNEATILITKKEVLE